MLTVMVMMVSRPLVQWKGAEFCPQAVWHPGSVGLDLLSPYLFCCIPGRPRSTRQGSRNLPRLHDLLMAWEPETAMSNQPGKQGFRARAI